jgi:hypothetical protein
MFMRVNAKCRHQCWVPIMRELWQDVAYALRTLRRQPGFALPPGKYAKPNDFTIVLGIDNPADAERIFRELAQNGRMTMPLQETFWAARYGALVDQFGIAREINCERAAESIASE